MNKKELKQIILEEFKLALSEMGPDSELYPDGYDFGSPEEMAADSRPEEGEMDMGMDLEEMARTPNVFKVKDGADLKSILQFMQRVNDVLKTYKSPGQKRPKKRFTPEEMKALAKVMVNPDGFTSKDVIAVTSYNSPAQANKFLSALEQKGLITLTSQLKKAMEPTRDPNAPETRGRKKKSAEFDTPDDAMDMDMSDFEDLDLSGFDDLFEVKKYIKQQIIKEAKSPLANKMKEVETRSRIAALETKLEAIQEMMDETNERLTRIDEDEEFTEMMDKTKVKEIRKQLKELERAQAKIQKEYEKVSGGRKKKEVVDEVNDDDIPENPNNPKDHPALPESKNNKMRRIVKENMINPNLKVELEKLFPEEWEGSWDDAKNDFVVPFEGTYMIPMEDVLDSEFWPNNINKVPTDWVLIDQFELEDSRRPNDTYIAKNFARLVPNEGIELKATTESTNGGRLDESILRMQKLAGLITESDIRKQINLNEDYNPEPASQEDWDDANPPEAFGFVVEIYPKDSDDNDGAFNFSAPEVEVFFDTIDDFDSNEEAKAHFNKLFDPSQEDMWYEFIEREAAEIGVRDFEYESFQPMIIR